MELQTLCNMGWAWVLFKSRAIGSVSLSWIRPWMTQRSTALSTCSAELPAALTTLPPCLFPGKGLSPGFSFSR
eukprot:2918315-Pyramimonas_sp.AAC.1